MKLHDQLLNLLSMAENMQESDDKVQMVALAGDAAVNALHMEEQLDAMSEVLQSIIDKHKEKI